MFGWTIAGICLVAVVGAESPEIDPAVAARVAPLAAELADRDYSRRQQATEKLLQGDPQQMLPDVLAIIRSGRPEAAVRANEVLAAWYSRTDLKPAEADDIENAMESLREVAGAVGERARNTWEIHRVPREKRAVERLLSLGAKVKLVDPMDMRAFGADLDGDAPLSAVPAIQHISLGRAWKGTDDDLKYIARLSNIQNGAIYKGKTARVSDAALEALTDRNPHLHVEVRGAFLGVSYSSPPFGGVAACLIGKIEPGSPADQGGLKKDDVITQFNDTPVETFTDLIDSLKSCDAGDKVVFTVLRDREEAKFTVELGDW